MLDYRGNRTKTKERGDVSMRKEITERTRLAGKGSFSTAPQLCISLLIGIFIAALMLTPDKVLATESITSCSHCHGTPPVDGTARNNPSGQFPGSHNVHSGTGAGQYGLNCEICHVAPNYTWYSHQSDTVQVNLRWLSMNASDVMQSGSAPGWGSYSRGTSFTNWSTMPATNFGTCSNTYCHSRGDGGIKDSARPITANISARWGTITPGCSSCHGQEVNNPGTGAPWYTSGGANKANSHMLHAPGASGAGVCSRCHFATTSTGNTITSIGQHIKRTYSVVPNTGAGISYTYAYSTLGGTCTTSSCHGTGSSRRWGTNTATATCVKCHGVRSTTVAAYTTVNFAAPGWNTTGVDTSNTLGTLTGNVSSDPQVGAHDAHLRSTGGFKPGGVACNDCHTVPGTPYDSGHMNGTINLTWSSLVKNEGTSFPAAGTLTPGWNAGTTTCTNTYCHGNAFPTNAWGSFRSPSWTSGNLLTTASTKSTANCNPCHISPPTSSAKFNHAGYTIASACATCHAHEGNAAAHMNGTLFSSVDCLACHAASTTKALGYGSSAGSTVQIRQVVGSGGDFNMAEVPTGSRHLYGATTIVKWDCTVCHREGALATGDRNATYHNDGTWATGGGLVHLRNVDTTNETIGWTIDNKRWNTTDYANLDNFCLSCHDSDGSSQVAVNATNNGLYTGTAAWNTFRAGWASMGGVFPGRAAMSPFNSTDWRSGFNAASTSHASAGQGRAKIVDVKSQFNVNNPSQHGVIGARYSTKNTSWLTAAWSSYTTKKTRVNLRGVGETAVLSCADCHVLDAGSGAHGGVRKYNMWASSINDGICARCHSTTVYGGGGAGSRFTHTYDRSGTLGYGLPQGASTTVANCMMCHASYDTMSTVGRQNSYGGIHGSWTSQSGIGSTVAGYRFFPGTWRRQAMTTTAYSGTTAGACYFPNAGTDGFTNCTSHSGTGTTAVTTPAYGRPVNY